MVLQDWRGGFLATGEHQFPEIIFVALLEMFAVRFGLQVAQAQGFQQVVVESDALKVIAILNGTRADSSSYGIIAGDVLQLASTFSRVIFIHSSRLCKGLPIDLLSLLCLVAII
ncbi:hypothetical protein PS2_032075 [Malus domestica]